MMDAEGINTSSIDASRHRLHFGHAQASLSATLNLGDFSHFSFLPLLGS
ncbi:MAG: hypothetical protein WCR04_10480 [Fibrobacteraceae bacterium]